MPMTTNVLNCQNRWDEAEAKKTIENYANLGVNEDIALRTYSARLLGSDPQLVLHGGGNTSVKTFQKNLSHFLPSSPFFPGFSRG